ncbi:MAG: Na/Pi cotransporter family protein [Rhizobiaceae bacterium]
MSGSIILLNLAGAVALLLWATRMVRTGVEAVFGASLRNTLGPSLKNPLLAALSGLCLAILFQSATAAGLLVAGFASQQIITVTTGIIALLGADLGSAIATRLLSFDLQALIPALILIGTAAYMATENRNWRQAGRILVGVGLLLLSLKLIGQASEPLRDSRLLPVVVRTLSADASFAFIAAAVATWLFHSSVASVLLMATLAAKSLIPVELGIDLMLGANFGGALIAAALTRSGAAAQRAVPLGNLMLRGAGSIVAAIAVSSVALPLGQLGADPALQIIYAHILFNAALLVIGLPLAPLVARFARYWTGLGAVKTPLELIDTEQVSALDDTAIAYPKQAIANATREVLRLCETIDLMLTRVIDLFKNATRDDIAALALLDDRVDKRHSAIKLYLARATANDMGQAEAMRAQELVAACVKLEQAGDIIVRNMLLHIQKMRDRNLAFTDEGWGELCAMHAAVLANAKLAFNVIVSRDLSTARLLVEQKDRLRELEKNAAHRHFERLREGSLLSIETSTIHLDTIRDLKDINALLASLAYPILEEQGLLRGSRLKKG